MGYCAGCGKELSPGARFCPGCGRAVAYAAPVNFDGILRSRTDRKVAGVCAGIARRYNWDVSLVRLCTVLIALFTFPLGLIAYGILWAMLPEEELLLRAPAPATPQGGVTG